MDAPGACIRGASGRERGQSLLALGVLAIAALATPPDALAPPLAGAPRQDAPPAGAPSAGELVDRGWTLLPPYDGEHRAFLSEAARRRARAAAHLFEAAVALEPDHLRALWSLGHARALLAEDRRNRGHEDAAREEHARAVEALSRAIELEPTDAWAPYARGAAHAAAGACTSALADFERAVANAEARIAATGETEGDAAWLRYKAMQWLGEVAMRAGRFERAREAIRAFHDEFSTNAWPGHVALAESHLRERDLAAARAEYEEAVDLFPDDHQGHALLAYVAGLSGDRERATRHLRDAIARELRPGLYPRLWLWILAAGEARGEAEADLRAFLEHPPSSLAAWDRRLGRFVLGEGAPEGFLEDARAERERRIEAGEPVGDLLCEAWYYAGLRHELDAAADEAARAEGERAALDAHRDALAFRPTSWKWEWAYARLRFAELAERLGVEATLEPPEPGATLEVGGRTVTVEDARWHAPRDERSVASLGRAPRAGDLLLVRGTRDDGEATFALVCAGAPAR